jgi:bifunctional DNase/RNase
MEKLLQMFVAGLVMDPSSNAPIVVLKDSSGDTVLPIWIGLAEATAIASSLQNIQLSRPMTHDLLRSVVDRLGGAIIRLVVTGLQNNTFLANLELSQGEALYSVDCRPSDGIALAVRSSAPIFVSKEVLGKAQLIVKEGELIPEPSDPVQEESFAAIDKDRWGQILASMDPQDFKYKM